MTKFYEQVKERLMRYARINTESDPHSTSVPTTSCQHDLASVIYEELQKIGATNVYYDKDTCLTCKRGPVEKGPLFFYPERPPFQKRVLSRQRQRQTSTTTNHGH
jgi:hypothetical protein|nr:MAG TPA: peptidase [Caudoviricetes sp.]